MRPARRGSRSSTQCAARISGRAAAAPTARPAARLPARLGPLAILALLLAACSTIEVQRRDWSDYDGPGAVYFTREEPPPPSSVPDAFEPANRAVAAVNHGLIVAAIRPLSAGWRAITSEGFRAGVARVGTNLSFPVRAVNDLAQGQLGAAGREVVRFAINTTVGLLGAFDAAASLFGITAPPPEDTGRTLGTWGWEHQQYVMLPLLGPSSDRNAVGEVVDSALDPAFWLGLAPFFVFNQGADWVETYWLFTQTEADPYGWGRYLWSIASTEEARDYAYTPAPDHPAVETLGAVLFGFDDPEFPRRVRTRHVRAPTTGREVPYTALLQPEPAPLVIVLPGLGGHRLSSLSLGVLEKVYARGASVVAVSSPFNHEFITRAARTELPGHGPTDARETHELLDAIVSDLEAERPGAFTERVLLGLSMGGFHALLIGAADAPELVDFDLFVAIDPPLNLEHGMATLDRFYHAPLRFPAEQRAARIDALFRKAFALVSGDDADVRNALPSGADVDPLESELPVSAWEAEYMIGLYYRVVLNDAIYVSQQRIDQGVLLTERDDWDQAAARLEIWDYSWLEYFYAFVVPHYLGEAPAEADVRALLAENDVASIADALATDDRLRVVVNQDDFLLRDDDITWLRETLDPARLIVFPTGGHLGNLHRPDIRAAIREGLADVFPELAE